CVRVVGRSPFGHRARSRLARVTVHAVRGRSCRAAARMSGWPRLEGYVPRAALFGAAFRAVVLVGVFATFLALLTAVFLVERSSTGRRPLIRTHSCPRPPGAVTVFDSMNDCALTRSLSLPNP